jgi:hypothetical protein
MRPDGVDLRVVGRGGLLGGLSVAEQSQEPEHEPVEDVAPEVVYRCNTLGHDLNDSVECLRREVSSLPCGIECSLDIPGEAGEHALQLLDRLPQPGAAGDGVDDGVDDVLELVVQRLQHRQRDADEVLEDRQAVGFEELRPLRQYLQRVDTPRLGLVPNPLQRVVGSWNGPRKRGVRCSGH